MKNFRLFRGLLELLGVRGHNAPAATPAPAPEHKVAETPKSPLTESLGELNAAMRSLDQEMLRLAQAWQALGVSLESLKQQKSQAEVEANVFGRIDDSQMN